MKETMMFANGEALDDRDSDDPDFEVDEYFSCTNTDFGGKDPSEVAEATRLGVQKRGLRY